MKSPTVSVIMATYNHADFVKQAIESVLAQQGVDFEFLITDDGSTDRTGDVVASIKDSRIRFYPNDQNRGACVVTNELIERTSGEFIALINSDDYWTVPDKLAYQVEIMHKNPGVGACFGRARFVDKNDREIVKASLSFGAVFDQENRSQGQWLRRFFDFGNCICHPTMLIRKSCYEKLGMYNNRFRQLPDYDMWIRLVKCYEIFISDRELINYRILTGENVSCHSAANSIRIINEHYLIAENFFSGVTRDHLIEGFSDILVVKDVPSEYHLDIEKMRMYFVDNPMLGKPYKLIGILGMYKLLNSPNHHSLLTQTYGIDDNWFQMQMSELDVLRPKIIEYIKENIIKISAGCHWIINLFYHK
jgi:glycosyltransferase involved in cell wall biosynthesis